MLSWLHLGFVSTFLMSDGFDKPGLSLWELWVVLSENGDGSHNL